MAKEVTWHATTSTHNITVEITGDGKSGFFIAEILASKAPQGSTRRDVGKAPKRVDIEKLTVKAETYGELLLAVKETIGAKFGGIRTFTEDYE